MHPLIFLFIQLLFLCFIPGLYICSFLKFEDRLRFFVCSLFASLSFWMVFVYAASLLHLPVNIAYYIGLFVFALLTFYRCNKLKPFFRLKPFKWYHGFLFVCLLLYFIPAFFSALPPGNDSAMHSYVSRLILIWNGIPDNFEPILPYTKFGSYVAGLPVLNACLSGFTSQLLPVSFTIMAVFTYPLCILSWVFLLLQCIEKKSAIFIACICFAVTVEIQSAIGWGGHPTVLSFSFALFSIGLFIHVIKNEEWPNAWLQALCLAGMAYSHLIPAMVLFYVAGPSLAILFYQSHSDKRKQLGFYLLKTLLLSIIFLSPFLVHYQSEQSELLSRKIYDWQQTMTHQKFGQRLFENFAVAFNEIKTRLGDVLLILSGLSLLILAIARKFKHIAIITILFLLLFLLFLNCHYWFLPFSELLYPERIVYFIAALLMCLIGLATEAFLRDEGWVRQFRFKRLFFGFAICGSILLSLHAYYQRYLSAWLDHSISYQKEEREAMQWIKDSTSKQSVLHASYADLGMWIPAIGERKTTNTHIHFIHEIAHVRDSLFTLFERGQGYYFITRKDMERKDSASSQRDALVGMDQILDKKIVFRNKKYTICLKSE